MSRLFSQEQIDKCLTITTHEKRQLKKLKPIIYSDPLGGTVQFKIMNGKMYVEDILPIKSCNHDR